jgi:Protein of unknown function (DUF1232)
MRCTEVQARATLTCCCCCFHIQLSRDVHCNRSHKIDRAAAEGEDNGVSLLFGVLLFLVMCGYILHPHDFIPEDTFGLAGLIDDLVALIVIICLVHVLINMASSLIIALVLSWIVLATFIDHNNVQTPIAATKK